MKVIVPGVSKDVLKLQILYRAGGCIHWDICFEESLILSSIIKGHVPHDLAGEERKEGGWHKD